MKYSIEELVKILTSRYGGADVDSLIAVLCPLLIPMRSLDKEIIKVPGQNHFRASFEVDITPANNHFMVVGRTGKFIPAGFHGGQAWQELAKGRIVEVDDTAAIARGEVYTGQSGKAPLQIALNNLTQDDYWEIDQYGAAAKVLSALVEYSLLKRLLNEGYAVKRMSEDLARHLGDYHNFDFKVTKGDTTKRVEIKSLWGTNTNFARLIHSKGKSHDTSSCKFNTQDIFAVSLFLRTGNINDFAFARSVSREIKPYGLPSATGYPDYVHQNPVCSVGNGSWFSDINEVWNLL